MSMIASAKTRLLALIGCITVTLGEGRALFFSHIVPLRHLGNINKYVNFFSMCIKVTPVLGKSKKYVSLVSLV